jgi:hypothetical protein
MSFRKAVRKLGPLLSGRKRFESGHSSP